MPTLPITSIKASYGSVVAASCERKSTLEEDSTYCSGIGMPPLICGISLSNY